MDYFVDILLIALSASIINNFIFYYFVGSVRLWAYPKRSKWPLAWDVP